MPLFCSQNVWMDKGISSSKRSFNSFRGPKVAEGRMGHNAGNELRGGKERNNSPVF